MATETPSNSLVPYKAPENSVISSSSYGSGRIVNEAFLSAGQFIGKKISRIAVKSGWGPTKKVERILKILGDGDARRMSLDSLYALSRGQTDEPGQDFSTLQKECLDLMDYALSSNSRETQLATFKGIVSLTTRYPHLRRILLRSKGLQDSTDTVTTALKLWKRTENASDKEWTYFSEFAAACISDGDVTKIVEEKHPRDMGLVLGYDGGVIESLLRLINCHGCSDIPCAMGTRYLGGILETSSFWKKIGATTHRSVVQKLFTTTIFLVKDIGIESEAQTEPREETFSDIEGVDILAHVILVGVKDWLNSKPPSLLEAQCWCAKFKALFELLIMENACKLLPKSRNRAIQEFEWWIEYKEGQTHRPEGFKEQNHQLEDPDSKEIHEPDGFPEEQSQEPEYIKKEQDHETEDFDEEQPQEPPVLQESNESTWPPTLYPQSLTQQKGLEITLNNITSCMDKARRALFELQKTENRGPNIPQISAQFTEFRRYLRQGWDSIAVMLQQGYEFGHAVVGLTRISDPGEMTHFLRGVVNTCEECINMAQALVPMYRDTIDHAALKMTVHNPRPSKGRASVAGTGQQSLIQFTNGCKDLSQELQNIANFFEGHYRICQRFLEGAKDSRRRPQFEEAAQYARQWKADELLILKSIAHVRSMCEAIVISPAVAQGVKDSKEVACIIV